MSAGGPQLNIMNWISRTVCIVAIFEFEKANRKENQKSNFVRSAGKKCNNYSNWQRTYLVYASLP
jgi:hypothetical protein